MLCPNHHDAATKGALSQEQQRAAQADPFNIRSGRVEGTLWINQAHLALRVGGVLLVGDGPLVSVDGEPLLATGIDGGRLVLTVALFSEDDKLIGKIEKNEWTAGDPMPWDIESDHQKLTLRSKLYDVRLDINAQMPPVRIKGKLWRRGTRVELRPKGVRVDTEVASDIGIAELALVGMGLDIDSGGQPRLVPITDGGQGMLVSEADPARRLAKALNAHQQLVRGGSSLAVERRSSARPPLPPGGSER